LLSIKRLQISRIIFFLSDEELKFDKYLHDWNKSMISADDLAHDKEDIYPRNSIVQGHIFKLTLNNVELSLYYSIRHFTSALSSSRYGERMYKYRYQDFMVVCCTYLNYITYLRPNIFQDRFLSVKRNKYKYLYFFILFIIIIEYYIPTGIIYNFTEIISTEENYMILSESKMKKIIYINNMLPKAK
jgi:hypothetical protein